MASTLQLVDTDLSTVLLDLNGTNGDEYGSVTWALLSDVEFSAPSYANDRFNFASADGGTTANHRAQLSQVTFRVLPTATSYDNLAAGVNRLAALLANGGTLKWIPNGSSNTRFRDFEPSDSPVLFEGRELGVFNATALFRKPEGVTLQLSVQPFFYGADLDSAANILANATMLRDADGAGVPDSWTVPVLATPPVANPWAWYRADLLLGEESLPGDGTAVSEWQDISGNNRHATQGTGADQPTFETNVQNGLPVVRFVAASTHMLETGVELTQPAVTMVAAVSPNDTAANKSIVQGSTATTGDAAFFFTSTEQITAYAGTARTDTGGSVSGFTVVAGVWNDASSWAYRGTDGTEVTGTTGTRTFTNLQIGAGPTLSNPFDGDIGEIIIYASALSEANVNTIAAEMETRWAAQWDALT
jgi:hypothetical protein